MKITQVSKLTAVPLDTLRYYEKIGIIPAVTRNEVGVRDYNETDIKWIEFAKCMRSAGLSIEALTNYLKLYEMGDETFDERRVLLVEQRNLLNSKLADMQKVIDRLNLKIERYDTIFAKYRHTEQDKGYFEE